MRWLKERARHGARRIRRRFLFLPKTVDGETRWLEPATWEEQYRCIISIGPMGEWGPLSKWIPERWIDEE